MSGFYDAAMNTSGNAWAGVRERVRELARAPGAGDVFGAGAHGFELSDPLTPAELAELEEYLGLRLPEEYRAFLLLVGAGGAGPAYGVFPVGRGEDGRWRWDGDGSDLVVPERLGEPFPVTDPTSEPLEVLRAREPAEEDFEDFEGFETACDAWEERVGDLLWSGERTVGAVCLCHLGCALRQWLVVSGPEAGRMWQDSRADGVGLRPLTDDGGTPLTFADWYLGWLHGVSRSAGGRP